MCVVWVYISPWTAWRMSRVQMWWECMYNRAGCKSRMSWSRNQMWVQWHTWIWCCVWRWCPDKNDRDLENFQPLGGSGQGGRWVFPHIFSSGPKDAAALKPLLIGHLCDRHPIRREHTPCPLPWDAEGSGHFGLCSTWFGSQWVSSEDRQRMWPYLRSAPASLDHL